MKPSDTQTSPSEFWKSVIPEWRKFVAVIFSSMFFAGLISLILPKSYRSVTTILALENNTSPFGNLFGGSGEGGGSILGAFDSLFRSGGNTERLMNVLKSRTVALDVVRKNHLVEKRYADYSPEAPMDGLISREEDSVLGTFMNDSVDVKLEKNNLIRISLTSNSPRLSYDLAKSYLEEFQNFINKNDLTIAKKNRVFVEKQLSDTRQKLSDAEDKLKVFEEEHHLVAVEKQISASLGMAVDLRSRIMNNDMLLRMMQSRSAVDSVEAHRIEMENTELQRQLTRLEGSENWSHENRAKDRTSRLLPSLQDSQELKLEYVRLNRESLILEKVFGFLTQQLEMAKIEESHERVAYQVIDPPLIPVRKYRPKTLLNMLIAGALATFGMLFWVDRRRRCDVTSA